MVLGLSEDFYSLMRISVRRFVLVERVCYKQHPASAERQRGKAVAVERLNPPLSSAQNTRKINVPFPVLTAALVPTNPALLAGDFGDHNPFPFFNSNQ